VKFKQPWFVADMLTDPDWVQLRDSVMKTEIRAGFSVPVMKGTECIGALACQFAKPYTPTQEAITRNQVFATLIAFAFTRNPEAIEAANQVRSASGACNRV
jgi:hypothetical protein